MPSRFIVSFTRVRNVAASAGVGDPDRSGDRLVHPALRAIAQATPTARLDTRD
jgi:hypothetical protein